jgi:hypothetical protein
MYAEFSVKQLFGELYAGRSLRYTDMRKVWKGHAMIDNRTREIRLSGMGWGLCGNVIYGGTRIPLYILKRYKSETLHLRMRAPQFYPES